MVVLAENAGEQAQRGFTPERLAEGSKRIARQHRMPIDTRVREYVAGSGPACRAVVAAREHGEPHLARALLRELRVHHFGGQQIDRPDVIASAAQAAGIDPRQLGQWEADGATEAALAEDRRAAREPRPAARVLDEKLANWSGGQRYTCPSFEVVRRSDGVRIVVPGFQPFAAYDVVTANLVPDTPRREPPSEVAEVLEWALVPIATKEVAAIMDVDLLDAREQLVRAGARELPVGTDAFWAAT